MNNMNNMMNNSNNDNDIIEIFFEYGQNVQKIKCLNDELVISIIHRYCQNNNFNQDSLSFYFNRKNMANDLTASEIGLGNNSTIEVQNKLNFNSHDNNNEKIINLIFNYKGKKEVIYLGENSFVRDGLRTFLKKKNIDEEDYDYFTFMYDDKNLFLDDKRKLKDVFFGVHAQINVLGTQL